MVAGVEVELVAVLCDKGVYGADCERHAGWGGGGVKREGEWKKQGTFTD